MNYKFNSIQELAAYENRLFDTLQEYCDDPTAFSTDVVLAIDTKTLAPTLESRDACSPRFDTFEVGSLLLDNQPDYDAVHDLATKYIFVR